MSTFSNTAREVEMPNGDVVVLHNAVTPNTTSNIKKFKYDDNGHVTESEAANATDLNLNSYSTPTSGTTAIGASDPVQTAIGKLDHQSYIDQTNILYGLKNGVKNSLVSTNGTITFTGIMYTRNTDDSITVSGSNTASSRTVYSITSGNESEKAGHYIPNNHVGEILSLGDVVSDNDCYVVIFYSNNGLTWANEDLVKGTSAVHITIKNYPYYNICICVTEGKTISPTRTFYPMICPQSVYNVDPSYQPPALPNSDLTYLEAEDRAALAEVVDSGAKNELQPSWTTREINGVKFTVGSDGVITVTTTGTRTSAAIYPLLSRYNGTKMTGKVMSISPKGGTDASYYVSAEQADSPWHNVGTDYGDGVVISSEANNKDINVNIVIPANYSPNNLKFSPMLCTKAAFGISKAFVPYRMPYSQSLTLLNQKAPSGIADYVASGSADDLPSGCALCNSNVTGMPALSGNYFIIRTRIYDANCAEQEAIAPAGNRRFNRTKWGGTWTSWAEYTRS